MFFRLTDNGQMEYGLGKEGRKKGALMKKFTIANIIWLNGTCSFEKVHFEVLNIVVDGRNGAPENIVGREICTTVNLSGSDLKAYNNYIEQLLKTPVIQFFKQAHLKLSP